MLGKIEKTNRGDERIRFTDSMGLMAFIEISIATDEPLRAVWIGEEGSHNAIRLDSEQIEALVAHLQAWLATRSFKIHAGAPVRPGRKPVSETVEADGIVQDGGDAVASSKMFISFEVAESDPPELQLMTVWARSLDAFDVPSGYARAALSWFTEYAKAKITAKDLPAG